MKHNLCQKRSWLVASLSLLGVAMVYGCAQGSVSSIATSPSTGATLVLTPANSTVMIGDTVNFTTTGGTPPYLYLSYNYPFMAAKTGVYFANLFAPLGSGVADTIEVFDSKNNSATATITYSGYNSRVCKPSQICPFRSSYGSGMAVSSQLAIQERPQFGQYSKALTRVSLGHRSIQPWSA